jgi:DNA-directed RNA polymerase subunit K/omega
MVARPTHLNAYEFVAVAALRAHQLMDGCVPHLAGEHKATTMAQMEVAAGKVLGISLSQTSTVPAAPIL